jgi:hypothetical protein
MPEKFWVSSTDHYSPHYVVPSSERCTHVAIVKKITHPPFFSK